MGVSRVEQLSDNVKALNVVLSASHRATLDTISAPEFSTLHTLFTPASRQHDVFGGTAVRGW